MKPPIVLWTIVLCPFILFSKKLGPRVVVPTRRFGYSTQCITVFVNILANARFTATLVTPDTLAFSLSYSCMTIPAMRPLVYSFFKVAKNATEPIFP